MILSKLSQNNYSTKSMSSDIRPHSDVELPFLQAENSSTAKRFDPDQPVQSAQADLGGYSFYRCTNPRFYTA